MQERRQVRLPVGLYALQMFDGGVQRSFMTSLSEHGCYLDAPSQPFYRRSLRVQLEISLPGQGDSIWVLGEVVHNESGALFSETAIRFVSMAGKHWAMLRAWLRVQWLEEAADRAFVPGAILPNAA